MKPLQYWNPEGFEISSYRWNLKERINKSYNTSGSDQTGICTYTYNSLGFRGDEPTKDGFKIMCIGDSNTEGVGVNDNETWPVQFCNLIPNSVNLNFGTGGRSNDFICRCLISYYDLIKPDLVLIMYTSPQRREIYTNEGNIEPYMPTGAWGYLSETSDGERIQLLKNELQNDNEDLINWYKNHLLMKYFLESKKCNWLWNGCMGIPDEYYESIRYDGEYRNFIDKGADDTHPGPTHNVKYSIKLYNHIFKNFRSYLPKNIQ
jgi:hypothetical protein